MTINLLEDERIDDLERDGYRIIQNRKTFCFGVDAVLLSWFAKAKEGERVLDLGTGTGVIPILMKAKTSGEQFVGLEIQPAMAEMATRSVVLNHLEESVEIIQGDIKEASKIFGGASFDVVTSNPPYLADGGGIKNPNQSKAIARHEVLCTLEDVIREGTKVLKPGGRMYMVHRPFRLADIITCMSAYRMGVRRICMVHPRVDKEANLVLVEAHRGMAAQVKIQEPVILYEESGELSNQMKVINGFEAV